MRRQSNFTFRSASRAAGVLIALSFLMAATPSLRAEEETELPPVVVTATKTEIPLSQAAASVTVIDRRQIEQSQAPYIGDLLRQVPGLDVVQSGGPGQVASVFLRGANSNQTLVLIDGIRVNDPLNGGVDFSGLSTDNIERIEIIRGPQSALYGSDAIGGVINIITRRGTGPSSGTISLEGGSLQTNRQSASLLGKISRFDYSLALGRFNTVGNSVADVRNPNGLGGLNSERDGTTNLTASGKVGAMILGDGRIEFTGRYGFEHSDLDQYVGAPLFEIDDPNYTQKTRTIVVGSSFSKPIASWWDQKLTLSLADGLISSQDPDPADSYLNFKFPTQERRAEWQNNIAVTDKDLMTVGAEYRADVARIIDRSAGYDSPSLKATFYNMAPFLQNELNISDRVTIDMGGRLDFNNRFENAATYRVEAAYRIPEADTKVRAAVGTGFHAPTLSDLFYPGFSNPNLKPEHSQSEEIGVTQGFWNRRLVLDAAAFYQTFRDLIVFDFDPATSTFFPMNKNRARARGVELEATVKPIERVSIHATYTYTGTRDSTTGTLLLRRPRNKAGFEIELRPMDDLFITAGGGYVGKRIDFGSPTPVVNERWVFRAAASYRLNKNLQAFGRVENLTDRRYEEIQGFGAPRRMVFGGMTLSF